MTENPYDMLIAGGGMVGSGLAVTCANAGLKVALIDSYPAKTRTDTPYDGRASAVSHGAIQVFKAMGLWEALAENASPINDIRVADGEIGPVISPYFVHYDHRAIGTDPLGYVIENRIIRLGLQDMIDKATSLTVFAPEKVVDVSIQPGFADMTLASGQVLKGALACICDGRQSPLRAKLGITTQHTDYQQTALVCTVAHDLPHDGVAVELFLPAGPFAMLPMTEKRCNIVWTEPTSIAQELMGLDDAAFLAQLRLRFGDWLGAISLTGPRFAYPLSMVLADHYTDHRLALVGDAARAIHPIAGQGFNLGVRDIAAMAETVVDARRIGLDIGEKTVLQDYARWRYGDSMLIANVCHGLLKLFANSNPSLRFARRSGLGLVNQLPPLKKLLMKHAMGVVGNLPRMVQGKAL